MRLKLFLASTFLLFLLIMAIFEPYLANDLPFYVKHQNKSYYPVNQPNTKIEGTNTNARNANWREMKTEEIRWALLTPYGIHKKESQTYASPFGEQTFQDSAGKQQKLPSKYRHLLGTDKYGSDVFAGIIHGARISISVVLGSLAILLSIGIFFGGIAGYLGNNKWKIQRGEYYFLFIGIFLGFFYGFYVRNYTLIDAFTASPLSGVSSLVFSLAIFFLILYLVMKIGRLFSFISFFKQEIQVPLDTFIVKLIEIKSSIPGMVLLLTFSILFSEKGISTLIFIIGLSSWTGVAQLVRAEVLKINNMLFIEAGKSLGFSHFRILFHHIVPNALLPISIAVLQSISSIIVAEAALSFLNIGLAPDEISWGKMLSMARESDIDKWWLVIFPGGMIFLTVVSIYQIMRYFNEKGKLRKT
jgi:peptide/nickel transport system permease protein